MYYYAHLQRRADDIHEGDLVKQGRTIGYVGDTGNAGPGNYHLHFSIARVADPKRYWEGTYVDPYPYLMSGQAPK
jgi:murein DD-endopeptidase MepM/ murein hydrolase activator NlpD